MATAPVRPLTVTGTVELVLAAFPSCPLLLRPQHCTVPPARVEGTARDGRGVGEGADGDRNVRVGVGTVAQLTGAVASPTTDGSVRAQRAGVKGTGRNRRHVGESADDNRDVRVGVQTVA